MNIIKVAWICSFSNPHMRERLNLKPSLMMQIIGKLTGKPFGKLFDTAIWNTNAIEEMEKRDDVELHVICPVRNLSKQEVKYEENGIYYYFFREENSNFLKFIYHHLFTKNSSQYKRNRKIIKGFVDEIKPGVVHVIGAENPFYSLALLDIPDTIPTIIQLQALLDRLKGVVKDRKDISECYHKGLLERRIINKADYIGTTLKEFRDYILENINPNAKFVDTGLAMGNKIDLSPRNTEFDFVYLSVDIRKAGLEAIKAFAIAHKKNPSITLDVVGGYDDAFKKTLDAKIEEYHLADAVKFEGKLPSHDDVVKQIRKAKYALLPLRFDFVPNTLREMMANGLPVVTTITDGTPALNERRESVLLSPPDDFQAMADNMIRLLNDEELQMRLTQNAALTEAEYLSNAHVVEKYCEVYRMCLKIKGN